MPNVQVIPQRNVIVSLTNAVCALAYTIESSANMVNGLADAGRIRSESFARVTASRVVIQEQEAQFDVDVQAIMLKAKMEQYRKNLKDATEPAQVKPAKSKAS